MVYIGEVFAGIHFLVILMSNWLVQFQQAEIFCSSFLSCTSLLLPYILLWSVLSSLHLFLVLLSEISFLQNLLASFFHFLENLNFNNNVFICLLFTRQASVNVNKNKFLLQLLFFIRKDFNLSAFAFLSNLFYLASFLTNKLFSIVVRY